VGRQETRSNVLGCCRFGGWPFHLGVFQLAERGRRLRGLTTLLGSVRRHPGCLTIAGLRDAGALAFTGEPQLVPCGKRDPAGDVRARDRLPVVGSASSSSSLWFVPERQHVESETHAEALAEPLSFTISVALTESVAITEPLTLSFAKPN